MSGIVESRPPTRVESLSAPLLVHARTPAKLTGPDITLKRYAGELHSLPALDSAAAGRGLLNATPDRGIVHRVELAAVAGTDPQPLFGLTIEDVFVSPTRG